MGLGCKGTPLQVLSLCCGAACARRDESLIAQTAPSPSWAVLCLEERGAAARQLRPVCLTSAFWPVGVWKRLLTAGAVGLQEQGCSCREGSVQLRDGNTAAVRPQSDGRIVVVLCVVWSSLPFPLSLRWAWEWASNFSKTRAGKKVHVRSDFSSNPSLGRHWLRKAQDYEEGGCWSLSQTLAECLSDPWWKRDAGASPRVFLWWHSAFWYGAAFIYRMDAGGPYGTSGAVLISSKMIGSY